MQEKSRAQLRQKWAHLRFSIIGPLLASPPGRGELRNAIAVLAAKTWRHPRTGEPIRFGHSTIERWYYAARADDGDPVGALRRRVRSDRGQSPSMNEQLAAALKAQHKDHPSWSYTLHAENLCALAETRRLGSVPSVSTVRRYMKRKGLFKTKRRPKADTEGARQAALRFEQREVRSFEVDFVHALWHLDFHLGSRRVLLPEGRFAKAHLFGVLDDRSRLCCHVQWYLTETAEDLVHGLSQAILKRGLPRALMTDNGSAMRAGETGEGLSDLGIDWQPTLSYSPYQNAKKEIFWAIVEGRLLPMLEGEKELSLVLLNEATQAWVEHDYNRKLHSEIAATPLARSLEGASVVRESPSAEELRRAFRLVALRRQRRSDGTVLIEGRRFEVPSRFGHLERVFVRYARWDLSLVDLWDPDQRVILARLLPLDKSKNAEGRRRLREGAEVGDPVDSRAASSQSGIAPLLRQMIEKTRASGLPPAYVPQSKRSRDEQKGGEEVSS